MEATRLTPEIAGQAVSALFPVFRRYFKAQIPPVQPLGNRNRRPAAQKRIKYFFALIRRYQNDAFKNRFRHLAAVPTLPLLVRSANSGNMPGILVKAEFLFEFLRTQDPSIIGQATLRIGPFVIVNQLPRTRNPNGLVVERELFGIFHKMKKMNMGTGKFFSTIHAEGIIPNDPTSAG